jgi:hypothetical protein
MIDPVSRPSPLMRNRDYHDSFAAVLKDQIERIAWKNETPRAIYVFGIPFR